MAMNDFSTIRLQDAINRRVFLGGAAGGLGYAAFAGLMQPQAAHAGAEAAVEGMKYMDNLDVYSVQELHAQLA